MTLICVVLIDVATGDHSMSCTNPQCHDHTDVVLLVCICQGSWENECHVSVEMVCKHTGTFPAILSSTS